MLSLLGLSENSSELLSANEMSGESSESEELRYTVLGVELRELALDAAGDLKVLEGNDPVTSRSPDFL